jgi:D-sedoheptulose 7-phosphate isomerase
VQNGNGNGNGKHHPHEIFDAASYYRLLARAMADFPRAQVDQIADAICDAHDAGRTFFMFGNGGSASLASHFACDLGKGTSDPGSERRRLRVIALTDNMPTITALANDLSYADIFSEQLKNFVEPGDVALAISCSGNSANVLKALEVANAAGARTIGLGGFQGGKMKELCDICLVVPSDNMQIIEDVHLSVAHAVFTIVRNRIGSAERKAEAASY